MSGTPSEIREALLIWLYDKSRVTTLPQPETAMLNGLARTGTSVTLEQLREAVDFLTDESFIAVEKPPFGGGRGQWGWRITSAGKKQRESLYA